MLHFFFAEEELWRENLPSQCQEYLLLHFAKCRSKLFWHWDAIFTLLYPYFTNCSRKHFRCWDSSSLQLFPALQNAALNITGTKMPSSLSTIPLLQKVFWDQDAPFSGICLSFANKAADFLGTGITVSFMSIPPIQNAAANLPGTRVPVSLASILLYQIFQLVLLALGCQSYFSLTQTLSSSQKGKFQ